MTRAELRAYGATLGSALALAVLVLGAQGLLDRLERDTEDRLAYRQWVSDACVPARARESAIAVHDGKRLHCTVYSNYERGMAPIVVSAAVMEVPQ